MAKPKKRIVVLGDLQIDWMMYEEARSVPADAQGTSTSQHFTPPATILQNTGGAWFVGLNIHEALKAARLPGFEVALPNPNVHADQPPIVFWDLAWYGKADSPTLRLRAPCRIVRENSEFDSEKRRKNDRLLVPQVPSGLGRPFMFIFDDMNVFFRHVLKKPARGQVSNQYLKEYGSRFDKYRQYWLTQVPKSQFIIGALGGLLPAAREQTIWSELNRMLGERLKDVPHSVLVANADDLRESGISISTGLSWERTAEDVVKAFDTHPDLIEFGNIRHVIVRIGVTGMLYISRVKEKDEWKSLLLFDPTRSDAELQDPEVDGTVVGYNSIVIASIVQELVRVTPRSGSVDHETVRAAITKASGESLRRCVGRFTSGFGRSLSEAREWLPWTGGKKLLRLYEGEDGEPPVSGSCAIPRLPTGGWSILRRSCGFNLEIVAKSVVMYGPDRVFNSSDSSLPPVYAPLAKFLKATFVDRQEIESFRAIGNLIDRHLRLVRSNAAKRPLSLAVFGPPGSGKSFGVTNVVKSIPNAGDVEFPTINLTQLSSPADLDRVFSGILNLIVSKKIPIVFFDEFDSPHPTEGELGWLKYFLAPMEDGKYGDSRVSDAIFVFAGGTSTKFSEFSREDDPDKARVARFVTAKGPDFVSRLRGHVDISGINSNGPDDELYLIRRAMVMRSAIVDLQKLDSRGEAAIDKDLLRGLLLVSKYKHGARSLRSVLELCTNKWGQIRRSAMPTPSQLKMHIDSDAFLKLIDGIEGRFDG